MIQLIRTSHKTNKVRTTSYKSMDELELVLKKLSSVHFSLATFQVATLSLNDFDNLKKTFKKNYNEEYFDIDEENRIINLNLMSVGKKRLKRTLKKVLTKEEIFDNRIERIAKKNEVIYNDLYNEIIINIEGNALAFVLDEEKENILDLTINGISFSTLRSIMTKSTPIKKQVQNIINKMKREP